MLVPFCRNKCLDVKTTSSLVILKKCVSAHAVLFIVFPPGLRLYCPVEEPVVASCFSRCGAFSMTKVDFNLSAGQKAYYPPHAEWSVTQALPLRAFTNSALS